MTIVWQKQEKLATAGLERFYMFSHSITALTAILAGMTANCVAASQNPHEPQVNLPPGWRVASSSDIKSLTAIIGPDGQTISYPAYFAAGFVAQVQRETDVSTTYSEAVIGGRIVDIAVTRDGPLAVSFPPRTTSRRNSRSFDYWTLPDGARQAVIMLSITLSHLDVVPSDEGLSAEELTVFRKPSHGHPFSYLASLLNYRYDAQNVSFAREESMNSKKRSFVEKSTSGLPADAVWVAHSGLLGGNLSLAEGADHSIWSSYLSAGGKKVTFVARQGDIDGAILAVIASLTYLDVREDPDTRSGGLGRQTPNGTA